MIALSLGWGTQSFGLAAMVALGELPPVDVAIHADTTHEASGTYAFAERWTPWLEERGVRVVTVYPGADANPVEPTRIGTLKVMIPVFTGKGIITRQCTGNWKIRPIKRWLQANRHGAKVEQLIGITLDEATRMKPSQVGYIANRWPLVELRLTRQNVKDWLTAHGLPVPPRSACVFCPFHTRREWADVMAVPGDRTKAIAVDESVRQARMPGELFIHPSRVPLAMVDLRSEQEKGQMELWDAECTGSCGL